MGVWIMSGLHRERKTHWIKTEKAHLRENEGAKSSIKACWNKSCLVHGFLSFVLSFLNITSSMGSGALDHGDLCVGWRKMG